MIDWLTFEAPLHHQIGEGGPFYGGEVMASDAAGELEWGVYKRITHVGSFSTGIQVQSTVLEGNRPGVKVSGNPAKLFQGHNIFGTDDLSGLVREILEGLCNRFRVYPSPSDIASWDAGDIDLGRVDVTRSWHVGTLPRVRNFLRALDATAHMKHRGRGHFRGDSLLFGEKSRRWSLQLYAKGSEIEVHKLPGDLAQTGLTDYAQGLLRAEVRMLRMQLVAEQLDKVSAWGDTTAAELHNRMVGLLDIAEVCMLDVSVLEELPGRLQVVYQSWKDGHDLRAMLPRNTFYRYRRQLLALGIDIAVKQERAAEPDNVIPLRAVLHAHPVDVPSWAVGTALYFEPRQRFAA